jgi:hypothetical protein
LTSPATILEWTAMVLQVLRVLGKRWTSCGSTRGSRGCGLCARLHRGATGRRGRSGFRRGRGLGADGCVDFLRHRTSGGHQGMRLSMGRRTNQKRECGITLPCRNRRSLSSGTADSGGKILWPGGEFARGERGESERRGGSLNRRRGESK